MKLFMIFIMVSIVFSIIRKHSRHSKRCMKDCFLTTLGSLGDLDKRESDFIQITCKRECKGEYWFGKDLSDKVYLILIKKFPKIKTLLYKRNDNNKLHGL